MIWTEDVQEKPITGSILRGKVKMTAEPDPQREPVKAIWRAVILQALRDRLTIEDSEVIDLDQWKHRRLARGYKMTGRRPAKPGDPDNPEPLGTATVFLFHDDESLSAVCAVCGYSMQTIRVRLRQVEAMLKD